MAKIEFITDKETGLQVPMTLDKKSLMFSAEFGDFRISDANGEKVRQETLKAIRERASLTWLPVIMADMAARVSRDSRYVTDPWNMKVVKEQEAQYSEHMGLSIRRFYAACRFDGKWIEVGWNLEPENRAKNGRAWYAGEKMMKGSKEIIYTLNNRGQIFDDHRSEYILPYSPELWDGLCTIIDKMKQVRSAVDALLGTDEGINRLVAAGSNVPLLGEPADK